MALTKSGCLIGKDGRAEQLAAGCLLLISLVLLTSSSSLLLGAQADLFITAETNTEQVVAQSTTYPSAASTSPPATPASDLSAPSGGVAPKVSSGGISNVTLSSLTLFTKFNFFFDPSVFFRCKGEAKKELPFIKALSKEYNFIGNETWQPLTTLSARQCKTCGIYQHLLVEDVAFFEWVICTGDFGMNGREVQPSWRSIDQIFVSLECTECSKQLVPEEGAFLSKGENGTMGMFFGIFAAICIVGVIVTVAALLFVARSQETFEEESERTRLVGSSWEDSSYGGSRNERW